MRSCSWTTALWLAGVCLAAGARMGEAGVSLQFNYSLDSGFFASGTPARASLEAAGDFFESMLLDDLSAIVPSGGRSWTAFFVNPATGQQQSQVNLVIPADTLTIYVGARDLGASVLGQAGPGGYSVGGLPDWISTVSTRGEGDTEGLDAVDFGPWGGSLAVDADSSWNQNHQVNPTYGQNDLYSVLLHELGHVLGFGISDSWTHLVNGSQFTGVASEEQYGGMPVPLAGSSHWSYSIRSRVFPNGVAQEAAMDPDLTQGTRKRFTRLDVAGLDDIGWDINYPTYLPLGDLNGDGLVGADDLDIVRSHWGQSVPPGDLLQGDPTGDGFVGASDLDILRSHWGEGITAPRAVPEPSALVALGAMGLFVLVGCSLNRWRRGRADG